MNNQGQTKAKIISHRPLSSQYIEIILKIKNKNNFIFKAGQYLNLCINNNEYPFSIASCPINYQKDSKINLHIKTGVLPQHITNNKILDFLKQNLNQDIYITGPYGNAYLRENSNQPIILIAGGGGYSPIRGILKYLIETKSTRDIHLFWGAGIKEHLYSNNNLIEIDKKIKNFSYTPVLTNPEKKDNWNGKTGYVVDQVIKSYPELQNHVIYMAGPVPMCVDAKDKLIKSNLDINNLYCDVLDLI